MPNTNTRGKQQLTLKDRLSRLTYQQACRLLGPQGPRCLRMGGAHNIDIDAQVYFSGDLFRLRLSKAVVTITLIDRAKYGLHVNCTRCRSTCEHVGAAFSLILEEKMALGLAAPPPDRVPIESLSEEDLVSVAIGERLERARAERMTVRSTNPKKLWTDYLVTNSESGKTYRVALCGWERGESFCSCPDFRTNTLGTCKHVLRVQRTVKRRFSARRRRRPHQQKDIAVHLHYGQELELRLLLPLKVDPAVAKVVRPIKDQAIEDVPDLLGRVRKLTALEHDVIIYPDAEEYITLRLFQQRMASEVAKIRARPERHPLRKKLLKGQLLPYQLDGIAFAAGTGRAILADDMGLGKTIQAIGVAELLAREAEIRKVLIVCPASVKAQWRSEISRFCQRNCQLVVGNMAERARQYDNGAFFTVCNYEQVLRDIMAIETVKWDLIVLDEGQRIKNWQAKTSRVIKGLRSPFALVLSGTPLENRLDELFSVTEFIDDRRLGPAFRFYNRHRVVDEKGKVLGYKSLDELRRQLAPVLLRRTRASVMQELPERTTELVRITPTEEQLELHNEHKRTIIWIVRKAYISEMDLLRLQKALLMCRMAANSTFLVDKQEPGYSSKLETLDDLLGGLFQEDDRKAILFSEWTTMLNLIEPLLAKHGISFVRLDGSVPQKKRQQLVHTFQNDPGCRLFLTTNAGATGLNLQAANTVINVDLPWNPAVLEQRIARAHRMGQGRPVQVFVLVTEGMIEESLLQTLSAKHELFQAVLDPDSDVDRVDLASGMEELRRRLEVMLGAKPNAPLDESQRITAVQQAAALAGGDPAVAGGQLVGAVCRSLDGLLPPSLKPDDSKHLAEVLKARLSQCVRTDDQGRTQLTLTLPDEGTLDDLAVALARMLELQKD